ncbi:DUF3307 domain-containing protein [Rhizobium sp. P32RR-XVIII]|uniref:DUF3307 domain-containing protein n=1 Tax=Rhizobium sp. P32RR-XVIII TaxID=2726738 RepID=UPI001457589F|nr:DUF3307 domain-containing protein [Rhizobium sp. P32RR-XVIII]NLS07849.1 DUF3307 domain-containing protein [Rhizobium sp. P32RR-XVIII]
MESVLTLALMLLAVHWLLDYPLQGDFLSKAKQSGPLRVYHLIAHSGIQGAGVAVITGNIWLGLLEWLAHTAIDEAKVRGRTTFAQDQASHIACRAAWLVYLLLSATLLHGSSISPWWR